MFSLETRLVQGLVSRDSHSAANFERLRFLDPDLVLSSAERDPKSRAEWLDLLRKQELMHQIEVEKWADTLGAANELLRKVREKYARVSAF